MRELDRMGKKWEKSQKEREHRKTWRRGGEGGQKEVEKPL